MPDDIDVWIADLAECGTRLHEIQRNVRLLTDAEMHRAEAILDPIDRDQWIAARVALHLVLADRIGRRISFTTAAPNSKPRVVGWIGDFSLSHSGRFALIAINPRGRIGIDLELRRTARMSDIRRAQIEAAGSGFIPGTSLPDDRDMRFLTAWTRLEAVAKMRATGIGRLLEVLGIAANGQNPILVAAAAERLLAEGPDTLAVLDLDLSVPDAVAAMAASPAPRIKPDIRPLSQELARLIG